MIGMKPYRDAILSETGGRIPVIEELQRLIGAAWHAGFDTEVLFAAFVCMLI